MFGAPKSRGWYCMICDTSNNSSDTICTNCGKDKDGLIFKGKAKVDRIDTHGASLSAEEIQRLYSEGKGE